MMDWKKSAACLAAALLLGACGGGGGGALPDIPPPDDARRPPDATIPPPPPPDNTPPPPVGIAADARGMWAGLGEPRANAPNLLATVLDDGGVWGALQHEDGISLLVGDVRDETGGFGGSVTEYALTSLSGARRSQNWPLRVTDTRRSAEARLADWRFGDGFTINNTIFYPGSDEPMTLAQLAGTYAVAIGALMNGNDPLLHFQEMHISAAGELTSASALNNCTLRGTITPRDGNAFHLTAGYSGADCPPDAGAGLQGIVSRYAETVRGADIVYVAAIQPIVSLGIQRALFFMGTKNPSTELEIHKQ